MRSIIHRMRLYVLLASACFWAVVLCAQDLKVSAIPDSLKRGACMVKRLDETSLEIQSPGKAVLRSRRVYTILNSAGDKFANVFTYYDKFRHLDNALAVMYDADGKVLKKVKKNEMEDWSGEGSGILMSDTRIRYYKFVNHSYPYTISYEEDAELQGLFFLPQWVPQPSPDMAVERSVFVIRAPKDYTFRYKEYGYEGTAVVREVQGGRVYSWSWEGRPAVQPEPYAPSWNDRTTRVVLSSNGFTFGGYNGSLASWPDMGEFLAVLYQGRDQLPPEAKRRVHELVDSLHDDHDKIRALYDFLQQNTHYVGIELGIGGWQPFDAGFVFTKRYGDCKALANYMVSLLKEAGITAYNVLIRAGGNMLPVDTAFACNQFNHVIAVAVAGKDSVWLECTSGTYPAGYLGSFTADRYGLLLDGQQSHLVHTPVYGIKENRIIRSVQGRIDSLGTLQANMVLRYEGLDQEPYHYMINRMSQKELVEMRQASIGIPNCTLTDLHYKQTKTAIPEVEETMSVKAERFATVSGSRIFILPGPFLKWTFSRVENRTARRSDFELSTSRQETDSVVLVIPPGYVPEQPLPNRNYTAPFGNYHIKAELKGDSLVIACRFREIKGIYPAVDYTKLAGMFNLIYRESGGELVFVRKPQD